MKTEIIITTDGSHTLYVPEIDETYHSTYGAIQESKHIFIEAGLNSCKKKNLSILEIGFGTGLNTYLSLLETIQSGLEINYLAIEKFPVSLETVRTLNYTSNPAEKKLFDKIHETEWGVGQIIVPGFRLTKFECDFTDINLASNLDLVFFDAFSPDKQPEMWSEAQFLKIFRACNPGATLTTYCAKGSVRRTLQKVGFNVERLPGPPGKREILRAIKP